MAERARKIIASQNAAADEADANETSAGKPDAYGTGARKTSPRKPNRGDLQADPAITDDQAGAIEAQIESEIDSTSGFDGANVLGWLLTVTALAWVGFAGWLYTQRPLSVWLDVMLPIALVSGPLILLGFVWMLLVRPSRRETKRFRATAIKTRQEALALEASLGALTARLEEKQAWLTNEIARLVETGNHASDRLEQVVELLATESAALDSKAAQLESAANMARVDIGVLISDMPLAEEQAKALVAAMQQARTAAQAEAGQLEAQFGALIASGNKADEVVGGTAQRLAEHLEHIESSTLAARTQIDSAADGMMSAVDETMARTAEAVDAARSGLEAQGRAILAMIDRGRAALERAGEESWRILAERLEQVSAQVDALAAHIATQDAASLSLTTRLERDLDELEARFAAVGQAGSANNEQLAASIETVRTRMLELDEEISRGRSAELITRANEMTEALNLITDRLRGELPEALIEVEEKAVRARQATEQLAPMIEAVQITACDVVSQADAAEASMQRQHETLNAMLAKLQESVTSTEVQLQAISQATMGADSEARNVAMNTGPKLVEALISVREAANQAAKHAREIIAGVIPEVAAELGEASQRAINHAIASSVSEQINVLTALSERANEVARAASERLTRQMLAIEETATAIETKIDADRQEREEASSDSFSQRVSLLIDALHSTAIDVNKILSNEVADNQWAAYLKGDRGIFTRRTVRLLSRTDARKIARHYQADSEFREQVSRYIHDFEALLQHALNSPDGTPLGVTILSSDMGKLYVALAQAINRLRT